MTTLTLNDGYHLNGRGQRKATETSVEYMASCDMSKSFGSIEALVSGLPFGAGDSMGWNGSLVSLLSETGPVSFDVLA